MIEKTRKFLVKKIPGLDGLVKTTYERYFLFKNDKVELRIQKKDNQYQLERVVEMTGGETEKTKLIISEEEFEKLKEKSIGEIIRDSYIVQKDPEIAIRFYKGRYEGLVRVETDMETVPEWFGEEITKTDLGRDGKLIRLTREEFLKLLTNCTI